jgi:hypothetical protein
MYLGNGVDFVVFFGGYGLVVQPNQSYVFKSTVYGYIPRSDAGDLFVKFEYSLNSAVSIVSFP